MPTLIVKQRSSLDTLIAARPEFAPLRHVSVDHSPDRMWRCNGSVSYDLQVTLLGKTGYGKSSLANALTGGEFLETSATDVCTKEGQCLDFEIRPAERFSIADVPGTGEGTHADEKRGRFYRDLIGRSDLLLYVLRADQRDWSIDEEFFTNILDNHQKRVLIVLNQCDKVEPLHRKNSISAEQMNTIDRKIEQVRRAFSDILGVVPVSVAVDWNIDVLAKHIVRNLVYLPGVHYRKP